MHVDSGTGADLVLCWPAPASDWVEAAPVGNGRLAAMVFGGTGTCRAQLNDATVWSGTPFGPADGLADLRRGGTGPDRLADARRALRAGDYRTAEALLMSFQGRYTQEFLPYADVEIRSADLAGARYGGRTLNLDTAVSSELLIAGAARVRRSWWASAPDRALCMSMTVDGAVDVEVDVTTSLREVARRCGGTGLGLGIEIPVDGAPRHETGVDPALVYASAPVRGYDPYAALALAIATDGVTTAHDGRLRIAGMTRLLVTIGSATSAEHYWQHVRDADAIDWRSAQPTRAELDDRADRRARAAADLGVEALLRRHLADVGPLLSATRLTVGAERPGRVDVPELLASPDLARKATVLFQWGRYLLVASSRAAAGPPANLQGIWSADLRPAWSSNYTLNINTEMNYWSAETAGLGATHAPLFDLLDRLASTGAEVATGLYGCRGWVAHHNSDMWGWALPVGMGHSDPSWAMWTMGGAWLAQHVWDHYDFGRDRRFLAERGWPILRDCALFLLDWLVEDDDGQLGTIPSTSPENHFRTPGGGVESLSRSTTMDLALIRAVFENTLVAAEVLGVSDPGSDRLRADLTRALARLRSPGQTADGRLREWLDDVPEHEPQHRHMSQMVAVYPLGQIDPLTTPELAKAAARVLDRRGPGAMGWSWAWKIALRGRLGDGDTAAALLEEASRPLEGDHAQDAPFDGSRWGGLLPNLFSSHPPFQIDGNYGMTAAIAELLVQSQHGVVRLLPALPTSWRDGRIDGVRCRGGLAVSLSWTDGALATVTVTRIAGDSDEAVTIRHASEPVEAVVAVGETVDLSAQFATRVGASSC